jgi:hypothetical protein
MNICCKEDQGVSKQSQFVVQSISQTGEDSESLDKKLLLF